MYILYTTQIAHHGVMKSLTELVSVDGILNADRERFNQHYGQHFFGFG